MADLAAVERQDSRRPTDPVSVRFKHGDVVSITGKHRRGAQPDRAVAANDDFAHLRHLATNSPPATFSTLRTSSYRLPEAVKHFDGSGEKELMPKPEMTHDTARRHLIDEFAAKVLEC
jgi:hypothetical protein